MVLSVNSLAEPVGSMKSWLRADASVPLPSGWLICDGSTVVDASSPFNGKSLPDMRGRHQRGHATLDNSNFALDATYFAGGTIPSGGADSINLSHSHGINSHNHNMNSDGAHSHNVPSFNTSTQATAGGRDRGGAITSVGFRYDVPGGHDHLYSVTIPTHNTGNTGSHNHNMNSSSGSANNSLGNSSIVPSNREFVLIIKVK